MPTFPLPLSLYVHIPWCVRKCPYCDFNSHAITTDVPQAEYIDALLLDLEQDVQQVQDTELVSIFIGGGTPSLFSPESIEQLLQGVKTLVPFVSDIEISLEANPGTLEQGRFSEFHSAGINRLSIGVQSFQDIYLERLGRIHDRRQAIRAVEQAHYAGFDSFNIDLMFGLPGQSHEDAMEDINTAIDMEPDHISWYQLTIEPNTLFHHTPPDLPEDESIWHMQKGGQGYLEEAGFGQYEISAYAKQARQCRHNVNYWQFGDYLGIGAGAHAKLSSQRFWKRKNPIDYMEAAGTSDCISGKTDLSESDLVLEFMMNALRLTNGFDSGLFTARTGLEIQVIEQRLLEVEQKGLIRQDQNNICATQFGFRYLNDLLAIFMP